MARTLTLETLIARADIHDRAVGYGRGVDRCDRALVAEAFHEDAVQKSGTTRLVGREIVDAIMGGSSAVDHVNHVIGNEMINVDGDRAQCEFYFISVARLERESGPATRIRAGRYVDIWERRRGEWRIAIRHVVDEWNRVDRVSERAVEPTADATFGMHSMDDIVYSIATETMNSQ